MRRRQRDEVWMPAARSRMGSDAHYPEEAPARRVAVDGFWIDRAPVTNRRFAEFVAATGYVTVAERPLDPADFPGAPPENLVPGLDGLHSHRRPGRPAPPEPVVDVDAGCVLAAPEGPGVDARGRVEHPVVHVAHEDAGAYAEWAGRPCRPRRSGSRRARRARRRGVHVGRRARAAGPAAGELLARRLPVAT